MLFLDVGFCEGASLLTVLGWTDELMDRQSD